MRTQNNFLAALMLSLLIVPVSQSGQTDHSLALDAQEVNPNKVINVALGKPVVSTDDDPIIGEISFITDGEKRPEDSYYV
jgi:hypothetical protein